MRALKKPGRELLDGREESARADSPRDHPGPAHDHLLGAGAEACRGCKLAGKRQSWHCPRLSGHRARASGLAWPGAPARVSHQSQPAAGRHSKPPNQTQLPAQNSPITPSRCWPGFGRKRISPSPVIGAWLPFLPPQSQSQWKPNRPGGLQSPAGQQRKRWTVTSRRGHACPFRRPVTLKSRRGVRRRFGLCLVWTLLVLHAQLFSVDGRSQGTGAG